MNKLKLTGQHLARVFKSRCGHVCVCHAISRTTRIRHLCRKPNVLSCHRCLIKTGVEKNEQHLNIDQSFDHQMSLNKSKLWY